MKKFLKEYRIELVAGFIFLLGIFLVVEQFEIRNTLIRWANQLLNGLLSWGNSITHSLSQQFHQYGLTDIVGGIFVILAVVFVMWRTRYRFLNSQRWRVEKCPKCGSPIQRVHRTTFDRFLGRTFLPHSRRFHCTEPECGWSGLLHHEHHSHQHTPVDESFPSQETP